MRVRRIAFFALWLISLWGILYTGTPLYYYIFSLFVIVFVVSVLQMTLSILSFNIRTSLSKPIVEKNQNFVWQLVPRAMHVPIANAKISVTIPHFAANGPFRSRFYVSPSYKKSAPEYIHITPIYCGRFPLLVHRVSFFDFLGLWYMTLDADRFLLNNPIFVTVLPDTSSFLYTSLLYDEIMLPVRKTLDRAESVGVRAYEPGDNMRSVHWKYSARVGSLHVKEYEKGAKDLHLIYIDLTAPSVVGEDAAIAQDQMLCGVSCLCHFLLREQVPLKIMTYNADRVRPFELLHMYQLDAARLHIAQLAFVKEIPSDYKEEIANYILAEKATLTVFSMSVTVEPLSFLTYRSGDYSSVSLCIIPQQGFASEQSALANLFLDKGIQTLLLPSGQREKEKVI